MFYRDYLIAWKVAVENGFSNLRKPAPNSIDLSSGENKNIDLSGWTVGDGTTITLNIGG
jgi:hypothetical protein